VVSTISVLDPGVLSPACPAFARDTFPVDGAGPRLSHWPATSLSQQEVEACVVSDPGLFLV
jgi:hypothetical protein